MFEDTLEKLYQEGLIGKTLFVQVKDLTTGKMKLWKVGKERYDKIINQVRESGLKAEWDESIDITIDKNFDVTIDGKSKIKNA